MSGSTSWPGRLGVTRAASTGISATVKAAPSGVQRWRDRSTEELTQRLERAATDPREQLRDVISLPFRGRSAIRAARIELAIRAWARRDAMVRQAVDESDAIRIGYTRRSSRRSGFAIGEARMRAFLLYSYEVSESVVAEPGSPAQREARSRFVEQLMLQRLEPM